MNLFCITLHSILQLQSKQRYDSGESGVYSSSSACPCGCGKDYAGCGSGKESEPDTPAPSSLYIPSSYITKKLSEVASSGPSLPCSAAMAMDSEEKPLDMSKTSSIFRPQIKREVSGATGSLEAAASHRDLFPGLYLLVDTALEVHGRGRPVPVAPLQG